MTRRPAAVAEAPASDSPRQAAVDHAQEAAKTLDSLQTARLAILEAVARSRGILGPGKAGQEGAG